MAKNYNVYVIGNDGCVESSTVMLFNTPEIADNYRAFMKSKFGEILMMEPTN